LFFSLLILDENDSYHSSSTSLRQRYIEKTDIDDFVEIPPIIKEKSYYKNKDSTKIIKELPLITNETGHPVIFRMIYLFFCFCF